MLGETLKISITKSARALPLSRQRGSPRAGRVPLYTRISKTFRFSKRNYTRQSDRWMSPLKNDICEYAINISGLERYTCTSVLLIQYTHCFAVFPFSVSLGSVIMIRLAYLQVLRKAKVCCTVDKGNEEMRLRYTTRRDAVHSNYYYYYYYYYCLL